MKAADVARRRINNSRLKGRLFASAKEAVVWHGAMQAQDYGPAKWSIGQRSSNLFEGDIDQAVADGSIVRTHVLRPTWHFVAGEDLRWLLALTAPRVHQQNSSRYRGLGLDANTLARTQAVMAAALQRGQRLTRNEVGSILSNAGIDVSGQRLPYILMYNELEGVICSGGLRGKQHTYALLDEREVQDRPYDPDKALKEPVKRYLSSHGPATVADLRWWSSLKVRDIRAGLDMLETELESQTIEGSTFWWMASDYKRPSGSNGAHLLPAYDELLVGYSDSRYFGDPNAAAARAAWQDRRLPSAIVLLSGRVAGLWRRSIVKEMIKVQILTFEEPTSKEEDLLRNAVIELGRFHVRDATVEIARI